MENSKIKHPVVFVGAGPGGLKAAEIAALRGHQVSVFEKDMKTGGRMRLGANPPKKEVYNEFLDYLEKRVKTLGASLELGRRFTEDMLDHYNRAWRASNRSMSSPKRFNVSSMGAGVVMSTPASFSTSSMGGSSSGPSSESNAVLNWRWTLCIQ